MANQVKDQEFLEYIVKALVDYPDEVKVNRTIDEMGVLLTLKVNPKDMGRIIGRQGSVVRAIRSLTRLVGLRNNARVNLKIEEPAGSSKQNISSVEKEVEDLENL